MLRKAIILLFTLVSTIIMAQTHLFKGNSSYTSDILYSFDGPLPLPIMMMVIQ